MGDRKPASLELGEQGLDISQHGFAGCRVAHMTDRRPPRQSVDGRAVGKVIADQPLAALRVEPGAVESDDAGGLLAAMLQRMQPKRNDRRRVGVIEYAKDAALLSQPVLGEVDASLARQDLRRRPHHCLGAGANGAFLLIKASSFCLSETVPLAPPVESVFFCGWVGIAIG